MSGTDFVFNVAKGQVYRLALTNPSQFGIIILRSNNLETDGALKDKTDISGLLSGTTDEAGNTGYVRKVVAATPSLDQANDRVDIDIPDTTWTGVVNTGDANNVWAKLVVYFEFTATDTSNGTTTGRIPLTAHSFDVTPDGSDITVQIPNNFYRAS